VADTFVIEGTVPRYAGAMTFPSPTRLGRDWLRLAADPGRAQAVPRPCPATPAADPGGHTSPVVHACDQAPSPGNNINATWVWLFLGEGTPALARAGPAIPAGSWRAGHHGNHPHPDARTHRRRAAPVHATWGWLLE
jgi:hypothetical protein